MQNTEHSSRHLRFVKRGIRRRGTKPISRVWMMLAFWNAENRGNTACRPHQRRRRPDAFRRTRTMREMTTVVGTNIGSSFKILTESLCLRRISELVPRILSVGKQKELAGHLHRPLAKSWSRWGVTLRYALWDVCLMVRCRNDRLYVQRYTDTPQLKEISDIRNF